MRSRDRGGNCLGSTDWPTTIRFKTRGRFEPPSSFLMGGNSLYHFTWAVMGEVVDQHQQCVSCGRSRIRQRTSPLGMLRVVGETCEEVPGTSASANRAANIDRVLLCPSRAPTHGATAGSRQHLSRCYNGGERMDWLVSPGGAREGYVTDRDLRTRCQGTSQKRAALLPCQPPIVLACLAQAGGSQVHLAILGAQEGTGTVDGTF